MEYCFNYYKVNKAMSWTSYPYTGTVSSCKYSSASGVTNTIGYGYPNINDPASIISALQKQPLTVAIQADKAEF
jgi:hypothetical protein